MVLMRRSLAALALAVVLPMPALLGGAAHANVVVRPGETLSEIAERHGVSLTRLMQANGITNPDLVEAGTRLVIPGSGDSSGGGNRGAGTVTVQPGDTLSDIADRHGLSLNRLMQLNGISNPDLVVAGQRLVVGSSSRRPAAAPAPALPTAPYTVKSGETLSEIADRFGTSTERLIQLNGISDPNLVMAGTRLAIPGRPSSRPSGSGSRTAGGSRPQHHVVQPGENLSTIADRYGMSADRLIAINNISDPDLVWSGARLKLQTPPAPKPAPRPTAKAAASKSAVKPAPPKPTTPKPATAKPANVKPATPQPQVAAKPAAATTTAAAAPVAQATVQPQPAAQPQPRVQTTVATTVASATTTRPTTTTPASSSPTPSGMRASTRAATASATTVPATTSAATTAPAQTSRTQAAPAGTGRATATGPASATAPSPQPAMSRAATRTMATTSPQPTAASSARTAVTPTPRTETPASKAVATKAVAPKTAATPSAAAKATASTTTATARATATTQATRTAPTKAGAKPGGADWRSYGPLQVDWSNWQPMGGSYVAPTLNGDGQALYLAVNCGARKLNATSQSGQWKSWDAPQTDFEQRLITDLCKAKGS